MRTVGAGVLGCAALLLASSCGTPREQEGSLEPAPATGAEVEGVAEVFVSAARFEALRREGAVVLDAREADAYGTSHIPGAVHTPWHAFVDGEKTGLLSADVEGLGSKLRAAGVRADRPVLVYADWEGAWGEEGRIFWMLEYLGHPEVHILEGGFKRWVEQGGASTAAASTPEVGSFQPALRPELRATADEIEGALESGRLVVLDIRESDEFHGATPYGEARGGHIPKAAHLAWRDVFTLTGELRGDEALRQRFAAVGVGPESVVVAYCTGGIRSGFVYAVLRSLGYPHPQNYDGSWWEWSSRAELPVEL